MSIIRIIILQNGNEINYLFKVAGVGRRIEAIESLAQKLSGAKGKLMAFKCDMTVEDEIVSTFQQITSKLGPISVLINNAGLSRTGSLINGDPKSWKTVLGITHLYKNT